MSDPGLGGLGPRPGPSAPPITTEEAEARVMELSQEYVSGSLSTAWWKGYIVGLATSSAVWIFAQALVTLFPPGRHP